MRLLQLGDGQRGYALDWPDWRGPSAELLSKYDRPIVFHNALFDLKMLAADGRREGLGRRFPQHLVHDTMVMLFLMNPAGRMDLKGASARYVDNRAQAGQGMLEAAMSQQKWTWESVPRNYPGYWQYGVLDTCLTALLAENIWPQVRDRYRYAYELEMNVIHCLLEAELAGLMVDEDVRLRTKSRLEDEIYDLVTGPLASISNPGSDAQVIAHLREIGAGEHLIFQTDRGNTSVDKFALRYVATMGFPIAADIEKYRGRVRTLGSYIDKFADVHDGGLAAYGLLHCNTRPVGARTGRMSITEPPLQTLPKGRVVRDCIIARPGHRLLMADFAGMEMRALASLAQEEAMLAAFARGEDMHNFVAAALYGPDFTKPQRSIVKNAAFAKIYGAGIAKFAATAGITMEQATTFLAQYDEMFPGVGRYMEETIASVFETAGGRRGMGWVELQDGRRLPVEANKAYVAVNYRIQGGTAVSTKEAICDTDAAGVGQWFRLAVHDELIWEVPDEHVPMAKRVIAKTMPRRDWPGVTLEIDQDEVERWGQHYRGDDYPKYVETTDPEWLAEAA